MGVATPIISHFRYSGNTICERRTKKINPSYTKYERLRESRAITDYIVAKILDIRPNVLYDWKNGRSHPRLSVVYKISQLFGVTIEDLLEDTK